MGVCRACFENVVADESSWYCSQCLCAANDDNDEDLVLEVDDLPSYEYCTCRLPSFEEAVPQPHHLSDLPPRYQDIF